MQMYVDMPTSRKVFGVPAGVQLRNCNVVIIGSTCRICGRDFKCETDVALHARWRHNVIINMMDSDGDNYSENTTQKYDICDKHLENTLDLKINKRLINKKQIQDRKRARKVRLIFKIAGVIITEITLNRKYLSKVRSNRYVVSSSSQTDLFENEKCQDDYIANIDLSLADRVVGRRVQCVWPHTATNRYIVGKFAFTRDNAITRSICGLRKSLVEISNTPNQDATCGFSDDSPCEHIPSSQEDEENSRIKKRERRRENTATEDAFILKDKITCYPTSSSDSNESLAYPRDKLNRMIPVCKQTFFTETRCDSVGRTDKISKNRIINKSTDLLADPVEMVDNDNNDINDKTTKKNNTDDDVQEVLRITRGKAQNDINHESPNRTEREILVQNAVREMYVSPARLNVIYTTKDDTGFIEDNNNISPPGYPLFTSIAENSCRLPTDITTLLCKTFDEKLGIHLDDLHHCGIRYCNDLPEINNNSLEEYAINAHEGFFEPWTLAAESRYYSEFKANDNEVTVVIE